MIAILCGLSRSSTRGIARYCSRQWGAAFVAAMLCLAPAGSWAESPQPVELYRVAIRLTSQQATGDLSQILLAMMARGDRIDPIAVAFEAGKLKEQAEAERQKEGKDRDKYHLNQEKLALDLARELKVWPTPNESYEVGILPSPELLKRFVGGAFPDVVVTSFPFRLVLPREAGLKTKQAQNAKDGDRLTGEAREFFCKPEHTLIAAMKCQVRVLRPAFREEPLIEVVQIGFRIETRKAIPGAQATVLIEQLRDAARKGRKAEMPDRDFTAIQIPDLGWQGRSLQGDAQPADPPAADEVTAEGIEKLWRSINGSVSDISHPDDRSHWPSIEVFDSSVSGNGARSYDDWLNALMAAKIGVSGPNCALAPDLPSHSDAVTSLLFPALVQDRLAPHANEALRKTPLGLDGAIKGVSGLLDPSPVDFSNLLDGGRPAVIGLAVYTGASKGKAENSDAVRLHGVLTSEGVRKILIVSAATKARLPTNFSTEFARTPSSQQDVSESAILEACRKAPFPSCMGQNPRVLVVTPLENREKYVVGASMVGIAAPGSAVPVVHGCGSSDPVAPPWGKVHSEGSSYAAPLVAAVIAKIMGVADKDQPSARDPQVAMLRILATADPLIDDSPLDVTYGKLNVGRALTGADSHAETRNLRATIYNTDNTIEHAVVSAYPWAHDFEIVETYRKASTVTNTARDLGLWHLKRGVIRLTGRNQNSEAFDLRHLVRIVRLSAPADAANPKFDVHYLRLRKNVPSAQLVTEQNVSIGVLGVDPGTQGYCSETKATPSFHACLYKWSGAPGSGFVPIDLMKVKEIVFSPNHPEAGFVPGFDPVEFALDLGPPQTSLRRPTNSPWRNAFCGTPISQGALEKIVARSNRPGVTANGLREAYRKYCNSAG